MVNEKLALVTGANGQDGYFLSKHLKRSGVGRVVGIVRPNENGSGAELENDNLRYFDEVIWINLKDHEKITSLIVELDPNYIFNFGAIAGSLDQQTNPEELFAVNLGAPRAMLECIRANELKCLFVQASSSEIFAGGETSPQDINTSKTPRTIYGVTKIAADNLVKVYRDVFGVNCYSVVLYSHESPLRSSLFFTKKIIASAMDIYEGKSKEAYIYSPDAVRDWGYAGDYCKEVVRAALAGNIKDQIIATGTKTTVKEFAQKVFSYLEINYDTHVKEISSSQGRAPEVLDVVAAESAIPQSFCNKVNLDVDGLVKLLIRFEKNARNRSANNNS
jgi:GDPmannose 4,6-dehydratase